MRLKNRTGTPTFMKAFEYYHNTNVIIYYRLVSSSLFTAVEKDQLANSLRRNLLCVAQSTVKTGKWQSFVREPAGHFIALEYI